MQLGLRPLYFVNSANLELVIWSLWSASQRVELAYFWVFSSIADTILGGIVIPSITSCAWDGDGSVMNHLEHLNAIKVTVSSFTCPARAHFSPLKPGGPKKITAFRNLSSMRLPVVDILDSATVAWYVDIIQNCSRPHDGWASCRLESKVDLVTSSKVVSSECLGSNGTVVVFTAVGDVCVPWLGWTKQMSLTAAGLTTFLGAWCQRMGVDALERSVGKLSVPVLQWCSR